MQPTPQCFSRRRIGRAALLSFLNTAVRGLAPDGVYLALHGCPCKRRALTPPFHLCPDVSLLEAGRVRGSLFSVTLSVDPNLLRGTPDCLSREAGSQGILLFGVRTFLPDYASGRLPEPACSRQAFLLLFKEPF